MRRRVDGRRRRITVAFAAAALCLLIAVGAALAAPRIPTKTDPPVTGAPWTTRTISLYDATPRIWKQSIEAAVADWNASGLKVRFALVKKRSAAKVVIEARKLKNMGGLATIGGGSGRGSVLLDSRHPPTAARPLGGQFIVTHELGHILGLDHARRACSVMNYAYLTVCPKPKLGFKVCGHVRAPDVKALAPFYGTTGKKLSSRFCAVPEEVHVEVLFLPSTDPAVFAQVTITPAVPAGSELVVERSSGTCSTSGPRALIGPFPAGTTAVADTTTADAASGAPYPAGPYCYRFWLRNLKTDAVGPKAAQAFEWAPPVVA